MDNTVSARPPSPTSASSDRARRHGRCLRAPGGARASAGDQAEAGALDHARQLPARRRAFTLAATRIDRLTTSARRAIIAPTPSEHPSTKPMSPKSVDLAVV